MFTSLKRIFRVGWLNFKRNIGFSLATVFIMVLAISVITCLFIFKDVAKFLISNLQEKVDISVYFKESAPEENILRLKDEVAKLPEVKRAEYVSQTEAMERFLKRYENNSVIKESLSEVGNPLLPSLNIKAREASQFAAITDFLKKSPSQNLIEKMDYYERKPVIDKIFSMTSAVKKIGLGLSLLLAIVAILVAFNQIRLAIYNSKEEIGVMRLVGASNWFIRGPFLAEGTIAGFVSAIISFLIFVVVVLFLSPKLTILLSDFNLSQYFFNQLGVLFFLQLMIGIGLGIISSFIAMRRHLKI